MICLTIDNHDYEVPSGITVLEACRRVDIYVPGLCDHPELYPGGQCAFCAVKFGDGTIAYACMTQVNDGLSISTTDPSLLKKNRSSFSSCIDISNPPQGSDIEAIIRYFSQGQTSIHRAAERTPSFTLVPDECVVCKRCERVCSDLLDVDTLDDPLVSLQSGPCIACG
jgi:NADH dehydrogenase/NADH:ubiquinone oxidoreductase subunit G